jgi:hypothetical protein
LRIFTDPPPVRELRSWRCRVKTDIEGVLIMSDQRRFRRVAHPLASMLFGVIFSIAVTLQPGAALACCTIPPPPPCETHPEMCA